MPATIAPPTATRKCKHHPTRRATWRCLRCKGLFCQECVKVREARDGTIETCRVCGDLCENFAELETREAERGNFVDHLPGAFVYPLSPTGIALLVLGFFFFGFIRLLSFSIFGKVIGLMGAGYMTAWLFKIVTETAMGKKEVSEWPDVTNVFSDIVEPLFSSFLTSLVSFGPAVLCFILGFTTHPFFFALSLVTFFLGLIYFPMAFLGTALQTRVAFYPLEVFGSIARVPFPYVLTLGVFLFIFFLSVIAEVVLVVISPFVGALLAWGFSLYLSVVQARILGLLYYTNEKRLGWFS